MNILTVKQLLDIAERARTVIEMHDEGFDEHTELLQELKGIETLCTKAIGASHVGCAADEVLLETPDDGPPPPAVHVVDDRWNEEMAAKANRRRAW